MRTKILSLSLTLLSLAAIAQKDEIRDAEDAVEDGQYAKAKTALNKAEGMLSQANDRWTERYYFYKGKAYAGSGKNLTAEDAKIASEAFQKAKEMGNDDADEAMRNLGNNLVQSAVDDQNSENFKSASNKLYTSYQMNKNDTLYLYYAAANSLNAQDYDTALGYFETLRDLGYDGAQMKYYATNTETGEQEEMAKEQRDLMVKSDQYKDPKDEKTPSKKGEIAKDIALIYINQGQNEKAIEAMKAAKQENPDDISLMQAEAEMYYKMGKKDKYGEIMSEVAKKSPNDPSVYYNLGVSTAEMGDNEKAIEYYKKALEIDPKMSEARMNIAATILAKERDIIDKMNSLGMSKEDNKKYDELQKQRNQLYEDAIPYLEKVVENNPNNVNAVRTAMNIYNQLGESEKAAKMKAMLENSGAAQEQGQEQMKSQNQ